MRFSKERITTITAGIIDQLQTHGLLEVTGSKERLIVGLDKAITIELSIEDRLNAEVRELLKQYDAEFQSGRADYQKMFTMVKHKLVRERGITL
ncbi:MAG: DUF507 family protein [Nitrospirota bacterium]|nr:DUF507 family protein [Nitrospirota bacterium]